MTQYYCYICEQNVNAIDVIKPSLTEPQGEQKEPSTTSHPHHELECEQCHQSYIEEVEPPQPTPTATTSAATVTPSSIPPQRSPSPTILSAMQQPAVGQPQMTAQLFVGAPTFDFFSSPPFAPSVPAAFSAPRMSPNPTFPFPFPFPAAQPSINVTTGTSQPSPLPAAVGGPMAMHGMPFPFPGFAFPFPGFSQPPLPNLQPLASHPGNYAVNNSHFSQLLSSFLHPLHSHHHQHQRGLDSALLARLVRRTVGVGEEQKEACVVCQCEMESGETVLTLPGCGHCFHVGCIEPWFKEHDLCPTCRKQVTVADMPSEQAGSADGEVGTSGGDGAGGSGGAGGGDKASTTDAAR